MIEFITFVQSVPNFDVIVAVVVILSLLPCVLLNTKR